MVEETARKKINLALQGGGAFGAFTWGVLDRILEDGRLDIEGVTAASAGAINASILKDGLARGGRAEARNRLAEFWRAASINGNLPDLQRKVIDGLLQRKRCSDRIFRAFSREGMMRPDEQRSFQP
jgi:NTE family protein